MRKIIAAFLLLTMAIILAGCSDQDTPQAQPTEDVSEIAMPVSNAMLVDAPEKYQAVWMSNTGKTVISVDAKVEMPTAAGCSLVAARIAAVTKEQVLAVAGVLFGTDGYIAGDVESATRKDGSRYEGGEYYPTAQDGSSFLYYESDWRQDVVVNSYLRYQKYDKYSYSVSEPVRTELDQESSVGNVYSYSAALSLASSVRDALDGSLTEVSCGAINGEYSGTGADNDSIAAPINAYRFDFTRAIGGVPVTYEYQTGGAFDDMDDSYIWNSVYEQLTVIVSDAGICAVEYDNPCRIIGENETANLLSFEEIMSVAASVFPLKYAYIEQGTLGCEITVDRIALGYMRVQRKDRPGEYVMIPVWDFFGCLSRTVASGELVTDDFKFFSCLTLNAVDGTVVDRAYGY